MSSRAGWERPLPASAPIIQRVVSCLYGLDICVSGATRVQFTICCHQGRDQLFELPSGRRGREAEGGGLLNRYTVKSRIEGSNPSVSAKLIRNNLCLLPILAG